MADNIPRLSVQDICRALKDFLPPTMHNNADRLASILAARLPIVGELKIEGSLIEGHPDLLAIFQYLAGNHLDTSSAILEFNGTQSGDISLGNVAGRDNIVFSVNVYPEYERANNYITIPVNWTSIANIYWLGHDLRQAIDFININGVKKELRDMLSQALHHAREIGLDSSEYALRLPRKIDVETTMTIIPTTISVSHQFEPGGVIVTEQLENIIKRVDSYDPKRRWRFRVSKDSTMYSIKEDLLELIMHIGKLCAGRQPGFKALPRKTSERKLS